DPRRRADLDRRGAAARAGRRREPDRHHPAHPPDHRVPGEPGDRADRGAGHGAVEGDPDPARGPALMRYLSTRGGMAPARFSEILLGGLAPDGGLVLPESYPRIDAQTLERWRALSYAELAFEILRLYVDDIPEGDLRELAARTYTAENFGSEEI